MSHLQVLRQEIQSAECSASRFTFITILITMKVKFLSSLEIKGTFSFTRKLESVAFLTSLWLKCNTILILL